MDRISDSGSDDWGSTPHGRTTIMKFKAMYHQLIHRLVASIANFIPGEAWTGLANTLLAHGAFKITVYCDFGLIVWGVGWRLLKITVYCDFLEVDQNLIWMAARMLRGRI